MDQHREPLTPDQHKLFFDEALRQSHEVAERAVQRLCELCDRYPSFREAIQELWEEDRRRDEL